MDEKANIGQHGDSLRQLRPKPPTILPSYEQSVAVLRIEQATRRIVDLINSRQWSHPDWNTLLDPDFEIALDHLGDEPVKGRERYLATWAQYGKSNPLYRCDIMDLSTVVDEQMGTAQVWMHLKASGHPPDIQQENLRMVLRVGAWWLSFRVQDFGWSLPKPSDGTLSPKSMPWCMSSYGPPSSSTRHRRLESSLKVHARPFDRLCTLRRRWWSFKPFAAPHRHFVAVRLVWIDWESFEAMARGHQLKSWRCLFSSSTMWPW